MTANDTEPLKPLPAPGNCPACGSPMEHERLLWQGMHILRVDNCPACGKRFAATLPVWQALITPYRIDLDTYAIDGPADSLDWFAKPLAAGLQNPSDGEIKLTVDQRTEDGSSALILNCVDYIFGHAILKVLNAVADQRLKQPGEKLILVVQPPLRWLAPDFVDEVWCVDLPFGPKAQQYYPSLDHALTAELDRFTSARLSTLIVSHPADTPIEPFTGIAPHDFTCEDYRLTYIWRGKRGWADSGWVRWAGKKLGLRGLAPKAERAIVEKLFETLRDSLPKVRFTVAGFGKEESFPAWIDDQRIEQSTDETERALCQVYAESRVVFGPHGSNMLLPTAHAGMAVILMSRDKWTNLTQDTLMHGNDLHDPRLTAWRYRYLPDETSPETVAAITRQMLSHYPVASLQYQAAQCHAAGLPLATDGLTAEHLHRDILPKLGGRS